jgi:hypothetical protein
MDIEILIMQMNCCRVKKHSTRIISLFMVWRTKRLFSFQPGLEAIPRDVYGLQDQSRGA